MLMGGQVVPSKPTIPSLEVRKLRAKLILEEASETIKALGFDLDIDGGSYRVNHEWMKIGEELYEPNLVEIVDGCCDLRVVTTGTLSACGIKDVIPQELVDQNNLEKFNWSDEELDELMKITEEKITIEFNDDRTLCCVKNEAGKILKPKEHKKPSLDKEIERQNKL